MTRKGVVKASVEREFKKIKGYVDNNEDFLIGVDSSRRIKVLTVEENNKIRTKLGDKEKEMYYKQYRFLIHSRNSYGFKEITTVDDMVKNLNLVYADYDNDVARQVSKKESIVYIMGKLETFEKKVLKLAKEYGLSKKDIEIKGKPVTKYDRNGISIEAGTLESQLDISMRSIGYGDIEAPENDYKYFKNKWLRKADIRYSTSPDNEDSINSYKYALFIQYANNEVLKVYKEIAKHILSGIK